MSPFLLATILAALVSTAALIVAWQVDITSDQAPPHRANLIVAVALAGAAWASVFFALCRDVILRRMDEYSDQLAQHRTDVSEALRATESRLSAHFSRTAADLAEQAEESGVFRGMEMETRRPRPTLRSEGGGQVIRHPRLVDAPAPERP